MTKYSAARSECLGVSDTFEPNVPEDFDEFWAEAKREAEGVRLSFQRRKSDYQPLPTHSIELIDFDAGAGALSGWLAIPIGLTGRVPSFLWIPPYGRESTLPNPYSTREGMVSLSFNFFGHSAFHQEGYQPSRGYFADGIESPETWIFRRMVIACLVAIRVLEAQLEADEDSLSVAGLSQGGGFAIATAAHSSKPKCVVADLPFLSAMRNTLGRDVYRYPLKEVMDFAATIPLGMERVLHTISYFDTVNQATRLTVPTLVSLGLKDPAVRPDSVRAVYNVILGEKRLIEYETGHDWHPTMIEADRRWMLEHSKK